MVVVVVIVVAKTVVREEGSRAESWGGASQIELILQQTCKHVNISSKGLETIFNLSSNALVRFL